MESLGHSVTFFQEDETDWSKLPAYVEHHGVQAVFWTRTWPAEMGVVEPVLKELAAQGVPTISYHLDRWFGLDRAHQVDDQPFFRTSLVVSPDNNPQWAEHGVNHFWLPPGVYGPECEPVPPNPRRWPYDVVFVGSHPYPHPEWQKYRSDLLAAFQRAFRGRFGILPRRGVPIRGRDLQELYATVPVVIGDSCLAGESFAYLSDRVPESLGRGACLIHPFVDGMVGPAPSWWVADVPAGSWFDALDLIGYSLGNFDQAVESAKWVLANPLIGKAIGDHGRATVLARDTYAHRMGTVLAVAEGIHGGYRDAPEGKTYSYDVDVTTGEWSNPVLVNQPGFPVVPPTPLRVKLHRWSAVFEPRPGTTDAEVCEEVWGRNDYRVPPEGMRGAVCVDIGANVGAFSVLAAMAGAYVIAVEPEPQNRARLVHHLTLNGVADRVTVLAEAVTDRTGDRLRIADTGGGAHLDVDGVEVFSVSFADLITKNAPVHLIKFDAEMAEWLAFESVTAEYLRENVKRISLEWHSPVVMPHLKHLNDGRHMERWGALVAKLADCGRLEIFGHPERGGLLWWSAF